MTEQQATPRPRLTAHERRESILTAATEVFAETGYQRGKTATVAQRVGVSEPVIFQNFGTKAALFAAVVTRAADHVCALVDQLTTSTVSVPELLTAILNPSHLAQVHAAGSVGALFADASSVTGEPQIAAAAQTATRRFATALTALLERGRTAGEVRPDLDTGAAAWWLLSLVASQSFRQATAPDPNEVETRLAEATLAFLTGATREST